MSSYMTIEVERYVVVRADEFELPVFVLEADEEKVDQDEWFEFVELEVEVECYGHFYPGQFSGPPERCYEDDYEFEIIEVTASGWGRVELTRSEEEGVEESFFDQEPDYPEPDPDDYYDRY